MSLKRAILRDDAFLNSVETADRNGDGFHLWWLGQSGYLIQFGGSHLLIDPYLSDSLTNKYATTDKPHVRITEQVVSPQYLNFIDVVTSSHNHTDHLDGDTLVPLLQVNDEIKLVIPEANRDFVVNRIHCEPDFPLGLIQAEKISENGFTIHAIPAAHNEVTKDDRGRCHYLGYVFEFGSWTIYHAGDTLWYDDLPKWLNGFKIDVALLPINGNKPERRVAGNLDGEEAARLAHLIGARMVIPCHYDMFTFNTADPQEFAQHCRLLHQPYKILQCGERWSSESLV